VGRPHWQEDLSTICIVIAQWYESRRTRNHTLLSHVRLPQPGGPGSRIHIPQEQGDPVIPPALGSLYVVSYDSQGYCGGILTLSVYISFRNRMVQSKSEVRIKSHVTTNGQSIIMSWCLVLSAFKGFHSNEFQFEIRRSRLKRHFLCYHWEGCMWNAVQHEIWVPTQHLLRDQGKTTEYLDWVDQTLDLPDANWLLASSPALNTRALTLVLICAVLFRRLMWTDWTGIVYLLWKWQIKW
jgi:hypothetical protein